MLARLSALSVALVIGGCHVVPPVTPEDQQRRAEAGAQYLAADDLQIAAAAEVKQAEAAALATAASVETLAAREQAAAAAVEQYAEKIAAAEAVGRTCEGELGALVELHEYLAGFTSEPRRDAALAGLEPCRKRAAAARLLDHERERIAARQAFARAVEEAFDAADPEARGRLIATPRGETLHVELRGYFKWRARDSREALDGWCATGPQFAEIVLRGPHGAFRCRPTPGAEVDAAARLRAEGLAEPWVPVRSGATATPRAWDPAAADEGVALARLQGEHYAAQQRLQAAKAAYMHAEEGIDNSAERLRSVDRVEQSREEQSQDRLERRYSRFIYVSIPLNLSGTVALLVGTFSIMGREAIVDGTREFATMAARDAALRRSTRNTIIGYSVGFPLAVVGLTLFLLGVRGPPENSRLSVAIDGIGVRF